MTHNIDVSLNKLSKLSFSFKPFLCGIFIRKKKESMSVFSNTLSIRIDSKHLDLRTFQISGHDVRTNRRVNTETLNFNSFNGVTMSKS